MMNELTYILIGLLGCYMLYTIYRAYKEDCKRKEADKRKEDLKKQWKETYKPEKHDYNS